MEYTYKIEHDEHNESPRGWDHIGVMVCHHRRYELGDRQANSEEEAQAIELELDPVVSVPLILYDHGGLSMSTTNAGYPFNCPWDAGQVGIIFAPRAKVMAEYGVDSGEEGLIVRDLSPELLAKVRRVLVAEVEEYDQWLRGDVWGFVIENENGDFEDSLWGLYGYDYAEEEAQRHIAWLHERDAKEEEAELERQAQVVRDAEAAVAAIQELYP